MIVRGEISHRSVILVTGNYFAQSKVHSLLTILFQTTTTLFTSFLASQVEWTLCQGIHAIHMVTHFTSSSATERTAFSAFGNWITSIAYGHVTVNEDKCMISNELEGF